MKKLIFTSVLLLVLCLSKGDEAPPPEPRPTHPPPHNSTTMKPTSSSTTTTTTPVPTETTTKSTTPKPTTASTTTTTTTPPPPPPTTTSAPPKPTPPPKPQIGAWSVLYPNSNETCLLLNMSLAFDVPYMKTDNTTATATVILPVDAVATSTCVNKNDTTQNLTLTWSMDKTSNLSDNVTFVFEKDTKSKHYALTQVVGVLNPDKDSFPSAKSQDVLYVNHTHKEFSLPVKMSYRCKQEEEFKLSVNGDNKSSAKLVVSDLQVQAFYEATGKKFDSAQDCESSETPGIVPIAVGCSLAALIIIVLIAYLIGRRHSQARGYLSMFSEKQREAEYIPMKNISCFGK